MSVNAKILAWQRQTGVKGDGSPVLSADLIVSGVGGRPPVPCELAAPSVWRRTTEAQAGNEISWLVKVPREPFRQMAGENLPKPGDRMRLVRARTGAPAEWWMIVSVTDNGGMLEIGFGKKIDGAAEVDA